VNVVMYISVGHFLICLTYQVEHIHLIHWYISCSLSYSNLDVLECNKALTKSKKMMLNAHASIPAPLTCTFILQTRSLTFILWFSVHIVYKYNITEELPLYLSITLKMLIWAEVKLHTFLPLALGECEMLTSCLVILFPEEENTWE
jgi:hypothetical protein